jgi:excisionase family DNA binding protein
LEAEVTVAARPKLLLDVIEAADALGCGRSYVYHLIRTGQLRSVKLGRLTRIPVGELDNFVAARLDAREER